MTLDQYIEKYNGKYIDIDGFPKDNPYQCVDIARTYIKEVWNLDPYVLPRADYAKNIYRKFTSNPFLKKIDNTPLGIPPEGSLIFWKWRPPVTGIAGHVAIFVKGNVNGFIAFGQNYGKPNFCKYTNYDYRGVMGWISPVK